MEVLSYACAALVAEPIVAAVNQNLHLAGAVEAGAHFTKLYELLKPYRVPGLGVPPSVELGVAAVQRALTDTQAREYLASQLGPGGVRAISMVLQAAGGPQREIPTRVDNSEPSFGDANRTMIQAAPAQYPSGVNVRNNFGGAIDVRQVAPPEPVVAAVAAPAYPPPPPLPQALAAPAPTPPVAWSAGHPTAGPSVAAATAAVAAATPQSSWGAPPPPPAPNPLAAPPVPARPGERPMPPDIAGLIQAAVAKAVAEVKAAEVPAPAPAPAPAAIPVPVKVVVAPTPAPKPVPTTPWGKRGTSLADYTFQIVTALTHLFTYGKLHLAWSTPEWKTNQYGLEWGWVRVTTTTEAEAIFLRLPGKEITPGARSAVAAPRSLHRHKKLPMILEVLGKLRYYPEIARALQLEHFTTRVYSPADDLARGFAEIRPLAWLVAAHSVRLGGALSIRHATFPDGTDDTTFDLSKWLDEQETQYRAANKSIAALETLRVLAKDNPLLDFANPVDVIDDEGRIHQVTAQSIFSPTAVLKGGKDD